METAIKTTLAQKNSEMEKLERSQKSHLRMISSSAARLRMKFAKNDDSNKVPGDTEAKNIRMYETHFPGFCYLRDGQCRKKLMSSIVSSGPDPVQCSEKVKAILFTDKELDIYKTMCLHLLGTHVQNRRHIQRKDGRLCSYVKAQPVGNTPHTLQPISQRIATPGNGSESLSKYDKILTRYVLDVKALKRGVSTPSVKTMDFDSTSDEETKKKRKLVVPIYINNEIRIIVNSVMEALDAVDSPKYKAIVELASSPEELRNMLTNEDMQDYITELAQNSLITKPTSYDFVMAHLMFDKIPEKGTLETVAQVLEVFDESELKNAIHLVRKAIWQRHLELVNSNIIFPKKMGMQAGIASPNPDSSKMSASITCISKAQAHSAPTGSPTKRDNPEEQGAPHNSKDFIANGVTPKDSGRKRKNSTKGEIRNVGVQIDRLSVDENEYVKESYENSDTSALEGKESLSQGRNTRENSDINKSYLHNLDNSQRILLGLKVASLKCKPINMHQFDGKKKVDLAALINPILRPQSNESDKQSSDCINARCYSLQDRKMRRVHHSEVRISDIPTNDLENLTRAHLANLRQEISETENKKRVTQFMANIV